MENKRSYWLRSGFFTIAGRLSVIIFGFGSVYLLLRGLTKIDFGIWVLFLTIASFIEVGRVGLQQNALIKYLSNSKKEDYAKISSASLILNLLITLGFILVLLLIAQATKSVLGSPGAGNHALPLLYHNYSAGSFYSV